MPPALNIMKDASLNHLYVIRMIKICIKGSTTGEGDRGGEAATIRVWGEAV
jgi:hypothetical protein